VYTEHALLRVVPVEFQVEAGGRLLLGLVPDDTAARALHGAVTAFEADRLERAGRTGWSVVVHGRAEVVRDPAEHTRLLRTGPRLWASPAEPLFVRLTADLVTGRRLHGPVPASTSAPGTE
jgi:hypothetical protein